MLLNVYLLPLSKQSQRDLYIVLYETKMGARTQQNICPSCLHRNLLDMDTFSKSDPSKFCFIFQIIFDNQYYTTCLELPKHSSNYFKNSLLLCFSELSQDKGRVIFGKWPVFCRATHSQTQLLTWIPMVNLELPFVLTFFTLRFLSGWREPMNPGKTSVAVFRFLMKCKCYFNI